MVQIGNGPDKIQLILDEPPDLLYTQWCNDRIELYRRVEPNASLRDVAPDSIKRAACRVKFNGLASDAIWTVILSNPEKRALASIADLGRLHEMDTM